MMQTYSEKRHPRRFLNAVLVAAVFAFGGAVASPLHADTYQFIISGYPATNPSHSDVSSGTSLAVCMLASTSAPAALEARARTCDDSTGIALRSDEYKAMIIIIQ